jgi:hypothetical protein
MYGTPILLIKNPMHHPPHYLNIPIISPKIEFLIKLKQKSDFKKSHFCPIDKTFLYALLKIRIFEGLLFPVDECRKILYYISNTIS